MTADGELTGNDYVSIPFIDRDASMDAINVLHGASAGLIEWSGGTGALLRPRVALDGTPVGMDEVRWRRLDRWIPVFTVALADGSTITGTICAPAGYPAARGFIVRIEAENRGRAARELRVELDVEWRWSRLWIATARPLPGPNLLSVDGTGTVLMLETDGGRGPALAIGASHPGLIVAGGHATDALEPLAERAGLSAGNGSLLRARITQTTVVRAGVRAGVVFHVGAGRERDGAAAAAVSLRRAGPDHLVRQARLELSHTLRSAQDHRWAELLNRNLLFNRYYAIGRAIDDDRLHLLRSRSPLCPAPAIFNEREALLWSLPALIIADPGIAREAMFRVFEVFSERSGEYLRYIDGGTYDSGFVLDQFLLYTWAVDHYATATGDTSVLDDPLTRQIVHETDAAAYMRLHPRHVLAGTELLPSGDPADYPFATMANALLRAFCERLSRLQSAPEGSDPPLRFQDAAGEIAAAIWHHCVSDVDGHPVLASSASLEGEAAVYDDPALSLALLPFFGFCPADDPVWRATIEFLRSPRYPLWRAGSIPGLAGRAGSKQPRTSALCSDLLTHQAADALDRLLRLRLPAGVAAAEYDAETGAAAGPHHAALAGFVAWTLVHAAEPKDAAESRRKRRR